MIRELSVLLLCAALMAGCGSPPKERFYVLGNADRTPPADSKAVTYSVDVDSINLPESIDRPQMILHTGPNQVELSELNRWAEPLKKAIPRYISSQLAQQLGTRRVYTYPQRAVPDADYRVAIDILRLEALPKQQEVILESLWSVDQGIRGELKSGHSLIREPATAGDYDALVAAHERALARLSIDIAESVKAMELARK